MSFSTRDPRTRTSTGFRGAEGPSVMGTSGDDGERGGFARSELEGRGLETLGTRGQADRPRILGRLHDHLGETVERAAAPLDGAGGFLEDKRHALADPVRVRPVVCGR